MIYEIRFRLEAKDDNEALELFGQIVESAQYLNLENLEYSTVFKVEGESGV